MGYNNSKLKNENINNNLNSNSSYMNLDDNFVGTHTNNEEYTNKTNDDKTEIYPKLKNILKVIFNTFLKAVNIIKNTSIQQNETKKSLKIEEEKQSILHRKKILLLWINWIINIIIFTNKELIYLFFSNDRIIKIVLFFSTIYTIIETLKILNDECCHYKNLIYIIYFSLLLFIIFKSLLFNKGWGWQFYLMLIIINFNNL